jgi:hypothetical protein
MNGKGNGLALPLYQLVSLLMRESNVVSSSILAGDLERVINEDELESRGSQNEIHGWRNDSFPLPKDTGRHLTVCDVISAVELMF